MLNPKCIYILLAEMSNIDLLDCFDLYLKKKYDGDNKWKNDKCEYISVKKNKNISFHILIISLNLYLFGNKINNLIDYPLTLDLNKYVNSENMNFMCNHRR